MSKEPIVFAVPQLGPPRVQSPVLLSNKLDDFKANYVEEGSCILHNIETRIDADPSELEKGGLLELAGPREKIYYDPSKVHAAIVTCGGLCPGINDVIRAIVMCLWYRYGTRRISGIQYGYRGFLSEFGLPSVDLTPDRVKDIHQDGGTILGSSRGYGERTEDIVDALEQMNVNMLFVIGGDGTQKGALDIFQEVQRRSLKTAVVGIPKTIDNDLSFVQKSFGFETAVSKAIDAVSGAHVEACGAPNGLGIVKVMGRESGYIAAYTALAINDVNYVLVPEVPFDLDGENGLLAHLEKRLACRGHAVILVAEGAGQNLLGKSTDKDASGNKRLGDIGPFLKDRIGKHFKAKQIDCNIKYIDPSYIIRSQPANPGDSIYCARLGHNAVHAAMSGKTGIIIGLMHDQFVHVPIRAATIKRNRINPDQSLWRDVIEATGQPLAMTN